LKSNYYYILLYIRLYRVSKQKLLFIILLIRLKFEVFKFFFVWGGGGWYLHASSRSMNLENPSMQPFIEIP